MHQRPQRSQVDPLDRSPWPSFTQTPRHTQLQWRAQQSSVEVALLKNLNWVELKSSLCPTPTARLDTMQRSPTLTL
eukprot:m.178267 g.178267  ORF g.178267 m.178267 type:complete len:76 (+) comp24514_c0_seq1:1935-2162(+)